MKLPHGGQIGSLKMSIVIGAAELPTNTPSSRTRSATASGGGGGDVRRPGRDGDDDCHGWATTSATPTMATTTVAATANPQPGIASSPRRRLTPRRCARATRIARAPGGWGRPTRSAAASVRQVRTGGRRGPHRALRRGVARQRGRRGRKTAGRLAGERGRQPADLAALQNVGGAILIGRGQRRVGGRRQITAGGVAVRGVLGHAAGDHARRRRPECSGRAALGRGIAWFRCAPITLTWSPWYGGDPVKHSYNTQANA